MPFPCVKDVDEISRGFLRKWKFPNCVGCIDGKHIRIKCPKQSGMLYYNYKKYFSIVLQGVVGLDYKEYLHRHWSLWEIEQQWNILSVQLECGVLKVQCEKELPDSDLHTPYVLIGDEGYPLKPFLMRPYPQRNVGSDEYIFNKRLSLPRQTVECAFGIISNKWRILLKALEVTPERADNIVKCICLLHNITIDLSLIHI